MVGIGGRPVLRRMRKCPHACFAYGAGQMCHDLAKKAEIRNGLFSILIENTDLAIRHYQAGTSVRLGATGEQKFLPKCQNSRRSRTLGFRIPASSHCGRQPATLGAQWEHSDWPLLSDSDTVPLVPRRLSLLSPARLSLHFAPGVVPPASLINPRTARYE
jgi:hypothetical protein